MHYGLKTVVVSACTGADAVVVRDSPDMIYMLKDLGTLLAAVGSLAEHYTGDFFLATISDGQAVLERLVQYVCVSGGAL